MANCQKNTDYLIRNASGQQIRNIGLSTDGKSVEIILLPAGTVECTFDINSSTATGLSITGDNLQIVDAIDGLSNQVSAPASSAGIRIIINDADRLEIIGISDDPMNMQANIRFDAASGDVVMDY